MDIEIRAPKKEDLEIMLDYINELSKEKTFIRFQGEEVSKEEEENYLNSQLEKIKNHQAVQLLLLVDGNLAGLSGINLGEKIEKHLGLFGITIKKEFRGQGLGSKLMQAVIDEAIKNLPDLEIIILACYGENTLAKQMYEKFGFKQYGNLPKGIKRESGYSNHILMYKVVNDK